MERPSAQISAIFHSPFHTKGTGTSKGLTGLFARNMNINWVRKKQNDLFFFFPPCSYSLLVTFPALGLAHQMVLPKMHAISIWAATSGSQKALPKAENITLSTL